MRSFLISRALLASAFVAGLATLTTTAAFAREGAQSVGKGIKCYTAAVQQSDGSYKVQRVCYKGV